MAAAALVAALGAARLGPCPCLRALLLLLWLLLVMMHQARNVWVLVYACYDEAAAL